MRIVDMGLVGEPHGQPSPKRDPDPDPTRPSVAERLDYYWNGPGWQAALAEAHRLIDRGMDPREVAVAVGWDDAELKRAMRTGRPRKGRDPRQAEPVEEEHEEHVPRTVKERVQNLHGVSKEVMTRARHLYEVEFMTIKEVSQIIKEPQEKTYLILIKARTKFRRPGRRARRRRDA